MTKELVISSNRHETKLAILEDDQLVEVYFQRSNEYSLVGSIHKGKVTRVLPGMQSAFVEIGLERDAFLYVSDFFEESGEEYERITPSTGGGEDKGRRGKPWESRQADRPQQAKPVELAAVAAPVEAASSEAAASDAAAAPESRGARGGDRDGGQGGRRRRRRRGGRGFPDAKYAAPGAKDPVGDAETELEPEAAPEAPEVELERMVLPGESIAKYQGSAVEPEPSPGPEPAVEETAAAEPPMAAAAGAAFEVEPAGSDEIAPDPLDLAKEISEDEVADAAQSAAEAARYGPEATATGEDEVTDAIEAAVDEAGAGEPEQAEDAGIQADNPEATLTAEVRDQPDAARFTQQRGGRRMRRRGGRDRGERPAGDRPAGDRPTGDRDVRGPAPQAPPPAAARTERSERPERSDRAEKPERQERSDRPPLPSIADLLKEGQEIIVQIAKEPLGQKGARITSHIAMPGRYVVYMPTLDHLGVSRKISTDEERYRLKKVIQAQSQGMTGGFIVRTAGDGKSEADIGADMKYLYEQWLDIRKRAEKRPAPLLLHHDLELVMRTLRDQISDQYKAVWVDNEEVYEKIAGFLERFQPALVPRVKLYTRPAPIFEFFNIATELEKALRPKVWLKSGGYIVINQTEALVAIDINTGKYVGKSNRLEDTIVKTNLEAIKEIVRQVRLRDLGGIIVVDFIDMDERKNRQKVMQSLEEAMRVDRAPYKILQFNDFGLVAITRRRVKQSLEKALCTPCPTCEGGGYVKSVQTVVGEILTEAHKIAPGLEGRDVLLRVHPGVAKEIKAAGTNYIRELEDIVKRTVLIKSDPLLHPEKFDLG